MFQTQFISDLFSKVQGAGLLIHAYWENILVDCLNLKGVHFNLRSIK